MGDREMDKLKTLDGRLDIARDLYQKLKQARWDGMTKEEALYEALLQIEYERLTAETGEEISVCGCGDVYFQKLGCQCGDWIKDSEDAYAHTMSELGLPYKPRDGEREEKVVYLSEWKAAHNR